MQHFKQTISTVCEFKSTRYELHKSINTLLWVVRDATSTILLHISK
jgi:hypothetical protein